MKKKSKPFHSLLRLLAQAFKPFPLVNLSRSFKHRFNFFCLIHYLALTCSYGCQEDFNLTVSFPDIILRFIVKPATLFRALDSPHCKGGLFYSRDNSLQQLLVAIDFSMRNTNQMIKLYFLPPYSPEYNPIERFWKWLKRVLYGSKSYTLIEDVISRIRQLIWHYHEKRLVKCIYFEFKAYSDLL